MRRIWIRRTGAIASTFVVGIGVAMGVTACAAAAPEPTPTVTVTVTAPPAANEAELTEGIDFGDAEDAAQPIGPYEAWSLCVAASEVDVPSDYYIAMDYSDDVVSAQADGSWQVFVGFVSTDETVGLRTTCLVSGTSFDPDVEYLGGQDFS